MALLLRVKELKGRVQEQVDDDDRIKRAHLNEIRVKAVGNTCVTSVQVFETLVAAYFLNVENDEEQVSWYGEYTKDDDEDELGREIPMIVHEIEVLTNEQRVH